MNELFAVDLFAGAGGFSEGLLAAGIHVPVAVELHPHAALTNAFNHSNTTVIRGDIRQIEADLILEAMRRRCGRSSVDLVVGGPPCQGFSTAGRQDPKDPRNQLVEEYLRLVEELRPRFFLFENVPAFAEAEGGQMIRRLLDGFWRAGYRIAGIDNDSQYYPETYPILDASDFGVPQRRRRLILFGYISQVYDLVAKAVLKPSKGRKAKVSVQDALHDLSFLTAGQESQTYSNKPTSLYQLNRRSKCTRLFNHLASRHKESTIKQFRLYAPGSTVSSIPEDQRTGKQRIHRYKPDQFSPAVLALPDDFIHYSVDRTPTVRELARLQSFDDSFVFLGKRTTSDLKRRTDVPQYTQVGNAVPPLVAKSLGASILTMLSMQGADRRVIKERILRHRWLSGSSSRAGYVLSDTALEAVKGLDSKGNSILLYGGDHGQDEQPKAST